MMKFKKLAGVGIVGFGAYVPRLRIAVSEIASAQGVDGEQIKKSLKVIEKSVANWDEDTATMAYEASVKALKMAELDPIKIGALYIGSESHPYAVKTTSTIIGEALGVDNEYMAADLEFACKAGTAGIQMVVSHIYSGLVAYGLVIGADNAQARPGDVLEYTAAAGAAAFALGRRKLLAKLEGFLSYNSDIGDFWRRAGQKYPQHAGRFTGEPAYFRHVINAVERYFSASGTLPQDYDYVVFHMPNGKFPVRAAERLGFVKKQYEEGLVVSKIGNPYSASSLLGLCRILSKVGARKKILLTSYGSGAGSDTLALTTTDLLEKTKARELNFLESVKRRLTYGEYRVLKDSE